MKPLPILILEVQIEERSKTKGELISELIELRRGVKNLRELEAERKQVEEALKESEAKWRSITENSPDIVMLVDADSNILFINRTVPGLTRDEVIGTCVYDYIPDKYKPSVKECHERVLKTGNSDQYETCYRTIEGEVLHFEARIGPVRQSGRIVGITVSTRDITQRKKAEEKLKEYQEHLEELVKKCTSEIEREILERKRAKSLMKV